jgi:hypothetical protein
MYGQPVAIDLAVTLSSAHPHFRFLPILQGSTDSFQGKNESNVVARGDMQIPNLKIDWALILRKRWSGLPLLRWGRTI